MTPFSYGRQAGWVPAPQPADKALSGVSKKGARQGKSLPMNAPAGATVYAGQPPVTDGEITLFVNVLPQFRLWASQNREDAHPVLTGDGNPDFQYSARAAQWIGEHGFNPQRFFCIMGKMAAALVIVEEGNDFKGTRPPDMPEVEPVELDLARKHMAELLKAGSSAQPINK